MKLYYNQKDFLYNPNGWPEEPRPNDIVWIHEYTYDLKKAISESLKVINTEEVMFLVIMRKTKEEYFTSIGKPLDYKFTIEDFPFLKDVVPDSKLAKETTISLKQGFYTLPDTARVEVIDKEVDWIGHTEKKVHIHLK